MELPGRLPVELASRKQCAVPLNLRSPHLRAAGYEKLLIVAAFPSKVSPISSFLVGLGRTENIHDKRCAGLLDRFMTCPSPVRRLERYLFTIGYLPPVSRANGISVIHHEVGRWDGDGGMWWG